MTREQLITLIKTLVAAGGQYAKPILDALKGTLPKPVYVVASWVLDHTDCLNDLLDRLQSDVFGAPFAEGDTLGEISDDLYACQVACPKE